MLSAKEIIMADKPWHGEKWPEGVPLEVSGYDNPLYNILDESAEKYPGSR